MKRMRIAAATIAITAAAAALTGCSTGSASSSGTADSGPLEFWGWVPGIEDSIALWNDANPDSPVEFSRIASGEATTKYQAASQAGNAPCLGQVSYDQLQNYVIDGTLLDVTDAAAQYQDDYLDWTWEQVSPGGRTYGIPQDTGPIVMYYRTDLFQKYGITVPTTWDEYATDAATVHAADPAVTLGTISPDDAGILIGYAWQNGARWFGIDGDTWTVDVTGPETQQVAEYWQGLIDDGGVKIANRWDPTFYQDLGSGSVLSYIGAAWNSSLIADNVAGTAGQWGVAQMPNWDADAPASANSGGSAVAVMKGCTQPEKALEFANWLNSSEESVKVLTTAGGLYPAATAALDFDVVNQPDEFFGGQTIAEEFKKAAENVQADWNWGPVANQTFSATSEAISADATGHATLPESLDTIQQTALDAMDSKGLSAEAK